MNSDKQLFYLPDSNPKKIMPKVSVVMASYNHASFVGEAVSSVLSQSFRDLELVVTDDGSSDGTDVVVRGIKDLRVRFVGFPENRGACSAINDAITRAQGEYIAVLNSDDYFLPDRLSKQVDFLDAHPEYGAVFGQPEFVDEGGRRFRNASHDFFEVFAAENGSRYRWLERFFFHGNCLCHPTVLIRASCYRKVGLFNEVLRQLPDFDMWVRLCSKYEIYIMPERVTGFRILDGHRNVSAPSSQKTARIGWETITVLENYMQLTDEDLSKVFVNHSLESACTPRAKLALLAAKSQRPGYLQFGLRSLQQLISEGDRSVTLAQYFKLVGELDPTGTCFVGTEHQLLKGSRLVSGARQLLRSVRKRMRYS